MLYVAFAAFDAFFKAGGSPKVGLEIVPKTIADSTQVLLLQEYSEYVESWLLSDSIVDCDRAPDASTKKCWWLILIPSFSRCFLTARKSTGHS